MFVIQVLVTRTDNLIVFLEEFLIVFVTEQTRVIVWSVRTVIIPIMEIVFNIIIFMVVTNTTQILRIHVQSVVKLKFYLQ